MNIIKTDFEISDSKILDYIFKKMSGKEEAAMERFLDRHQDYALAIDGLLSLCVQQQLDRKALEQILKKSRANFLQRLAPESAKEKAASRVKKAGQSIAAELKQTLDYTLEQLCEFFSPLPHYEMQLAAVTRSNRLTVLEPKNGIEVSMKLKFALEKTVKTPVTVKVEDNREQLVYETIIAPKSKKFELDLSSFIPHPGRYYWKLKHGDDVAIGMFYVGKDLNPLD